MDNVSIKMKNCFGINELDHNFVFSDKKNAYIIYARNGVFKTSFAKTLHYYQKGETDKIQDLIFGKKVNFQLQESLIQTFLLLNLMIKNMKQK